MNFLPIVGRELRVATRQRATYWSRVITAVVAVGLTAWVLQTLGAIASPELVGGRLFRIVTHLGLFFSLLAGVMLTADSLSLEKREGTLGLLFLTNLKGHDVVLGKLFGTSLAPFCALLAVFPVLALPLILGGVTLGEFWRTAAALANAMFFGLASGLCASAISWHAQRAVLGAGGLVVAAWVLAGITPPWTLLSPVTAFRAAPDPRFGGRAGLFLISLALSHGLGWLMLGLASYWARRRWRQDPVPAGSVVPLVVNRCQESPRQQHAPDGCDPADWLAAKGTQQRWVWGSLGLAILGWLVGSLIGIGRLGLPFACLLGAVSIELVLQFWIAWEAGRRFGDLRRTGLLETLLVSPLTVESIVHAQLGSLRQQFIGPVIGVLIFQFFLLLLAAIGHRWSPGDSPAFMAIMLTAMIWTVVTAYGLGWVGLWLGLAPRKGIEAGLRALAWVVGAPLAAFLCLSSLLMAGGPRNLDGPSVAAVLLIVLGSVSAHFSVEFARRMLLSRFRGVAAGEM